MNDELIDAIANTCWYYQGQHLKEGKELPCICNALKDMAILTIENMKDMERKTGTTHLVEPGSSTSNTTTTDTCDECGNDLPAEGENKCLECLENMIR